MQDQTDPIFLLYSIAIVQFFILGLLVYKKSGKNNLQLIFIVSLLVAMTSFVAGFLLIWSGYIIHLPFLLGKGLPIVYLFGPLIWLIFSTEQASTLDPKQFLHFLPFLLVLLFNFRSYLLPLESRMTHYQEDIVTEQAFQSIQYILYTFLKALHLIVYIFLIRQRVIKDHFRFTKLNRPIWLSFLVVGVLLCIHSLLLLLKLPGYAMTYITLVSIVGFLGFWLQWVLIFDADKSKLEKYQKSGLSEQFVSNEAERIQSLVKKQELFKDPELRLSTLSEKLNLSTHHLSQIINQVFEKNFADYINEQRVEFAKKELLSNARQRTIQEIAFDAGFNSKNSFYRSFKKFTGMSPTEFRKDKRPV